MGAFREIMTFIRTFLGVLALLAFPFEASAQSIQDLMDEALKIPQVRDAMRGRVPQVQRAKDPGILEIQTLLNARGFNAGTPDGVAGPGTRRAIAAFQQSINHTLTGTISEEELAILRSDAGPAKPAGAAKAQKPEPVDIRTVQSNLADLSYDPGPVDGAWGKRSQAALDLFRRDQNGSVGGSPTSEDVALLQSALAPAEASEDVVITPDIASKPTLFALPVVDRGAEFRVAWDNAPADIAVGVVSLWSDVLPDVMQSGLQPVSMTAPDLPGLYHVVMINAENNEIETRFVMEVR